MAIHGEKDTNTRRAVGYIGMAVLSLYGAACLVPAIYVDDGIATSDLEFKDGSPIGLTILLFGWCGGNKGIPWSANIFLALGLYKLLVGRFQAAYVLGSIATLLGLTTLWVWGWDRLLLGYFLWQASLVVLAAGTAWSVCERKER